MQSIEVLSEQGKMLRDKTPDRDWLNPISMSKLKTAVLAKKKEVELNGKIYTIEYGHIFRSKVMQEDHEAVCLRIKNPPYKPIAPFGYVGMRRILSFEFERK